MEVLNYFGTVEPSSHGNRHIIELNVRLQQIGACVRVYMMCWKIWTKINYPERMHTEYSTIVNNPWIPGIEKNEFSDYSQKEKK